MEKNIIVSFDFYSWVEKCAGIVLEKPKTYEVIIVCSNDTIPIYHYKDLCPQAVYEQRKEDLYNIGKELKIPKISNLLFDESRIDSLQLAIHLQLPIAVSQITSIYYQDNKYLNPIFNKINKTMKIKTYKYKDEDTEDFHFRYNLTNDQLVTKKRILDLIVGGTKESYFPSKIEKFYKV